jgi:hypothetical protein
MKKKSKVAKAKKKPVDRMTRLVADILGGLETLGEDVNLMASLIAGGAVVPPGTIEKISARLDRIGSDVAPLKAEPVPLLPEPPKEVPPVV